MVHALLPFRRMAPSKGTMNPFASEHDVHSEENPSMRSTPMQGIRRKPVSRNEQPEQVMQSGGEGLSPITENRHSYGHDPNATFEFPRKPSLRETVSADSLQAQARTESVEDASSSLMGDHHDTPQSHDARRDSEPRPEREPGRQQQDTDSPEGLSSKRQHGFKEHAKAWAPELGWILLAVALFIALCVVLNQYDRSTLPNWPMGLTLNTLVAFLATICRSVLIIPIGEGLSQLKWNWFVAKKRPIKDLYIFDQASRGPWGSIRLIFRMKGRLMPLSHLASVILIAGLVTSFLTQSAISYSTRLVDGSVPTTAIAKRALAYPVNSEGHTTQHELDSMKSNIFQAAFLNVKTAWPDTEPRCSGANCTWPVFSSIGACATLSNVTDLLEVDDTRDEFGEDALNVSLPLTYGTAYLIENIEDGAEGMQPIVNMTSIEPVDKTMNLNVSDMTEEEFAEAFQDAYTWPPERESLGDWGNQDLLPSTFSQFYFIYANDNVERATADRYRAVELLWHFCVHDYEVEVRDGEPRTNTLNVTTTIDRVEKSDARGAGVNTIWLSNSAGNETFPVKEKWEYTRLDLDFRRAFVGAHSTRWSTEADYSEFNRQFGLNLYDSVDRNMSVEDTDAKMFDNLGRLSSNIARSITSHMRKEEVSGEVVGKTPVQETFITVRWEWLSFLAAQLGLTLVFLLAIILHTASLDIDIVKSSNISELFANRGLGASDQTSDDVDSGESTKLIGIKNGLDKTVQGQLLREGLRWRLHVARERPPDVKYQ